MAPVVTQAIEDIRRCTVSVDYDVAIELATQLVEDLCAADPQLRAPHVSQQCHTLCLRWDQVWVWFVPRVSAAPADTGWGCAVAVTNDRTAAFGGESRVMFDCVRRLRVPDDVCVCDTCHSPLLVAVQSPRGRCRNCAARR